MGIKTYQEKNTKSMEKDLAQSDIPVKSKIPKNHPKIALSLREEKRNTGTSDWRPQAALPVAASQIYCVLATAPTSVLTTGAAGQHR